MKKETLEEACNNVLNYFYPNCKKEMSALQYTNAINSLKSIAKWKEKQMYSEEEVLKLLLNIKRVNIYYEDVEKWFEQFKKK